MNTKVLLSLPLLLLALAAAGCGSSSTAREESSISKSAFIKQADAHCTRGNKKREAMVAIYGKEHHLGPHRPLNQARTADMISTLMLPEIQEEADTLRSRTVPEGDRAKVDAIAQALETGVREAKKNPIIVLDEVHTPLVKARELAKAYGFQICGQY